MKRIAATVFVITLTGAAPAMADEAIQTHSGANPAAEAPVEGGARGPDRDQRQANGDWARRVMAGQPTDEPDEDVTSRGCHRNPDRRPHGEVWAGVGTGGYKTVGAVVSQPIGDCTEVTVAVSQTDQGRVRGGRRGRR